MRRRITITVDDSISDATALELVRSVVDHGRISADGACYCYLTTFGAGAVAAALTRTGNDAFLVMPADYEVNW